MGTVARRPPTCPACGSHDVAELCSTRIAYPILDVIEGDPQTGVGVTASDGDFDSFECRDCGEEASSLDHFLRCAGDNEDGRLVHNRGSCPMHRRRACSAKTDRSD